MTNLLLKLVEIHHSTRPRKQQPRARRAEARVSGLRQEGGRVDTSRMEFVATRHGFLVFRLSTGQFVVHHPEEGPEERLQLMRRLAAQDSVDALFFESFREAEEWLRAMTSIFPASKDST
jgi:hypothetical protein